MTVPLCRNAFSKYSAFIFDLSGVLVDAGVRIPYNALTSAFHSHGVYMPDNMIHFALGRNEEKYIDSICKIHKCGRKYNKIYNTYKEHLIKMNESTYFNAPINGAVKLTNELKNQGYLIGITTNYNRDIFNVIKPTLDKNGIIYDYVVCRDDVVSGRPEPFILYKMLGGLKLYNTDVIKIGESYLNLCESFNAKIDTINVIDTCSEMGVEEETFDDMCHVVKDIKRKRVMDRLAFYYQPKYYINSIDELYKIIKT
jgi:phosphonoacetaldehyde hydrolase